MGEIELKNGQEVYILKKGNNILDAIKGYVTRRVMIDDIVSYEVLDIEGNKHFYFYSKSLSSNIECIVTELEYFGLLRMYKESNNRQIEEIRNTNSDIDIKMKEVGTLLISKNETGIKESDFLSKEEVLYKVIGEKASEIRSGK